MPPLVCYSLEEAAEKLNISETVLVRLSQYFKVPEVAYEETGFLSFKGDLSFTDRDVHFFREVRERLLAGYNMEQVRHYFSQQSIRETQNADAGPEDDSDPSEAKPFNTYIQPGAAPTGATRPRPETTSTLVRSALHEIEDPTPLQKVAEKTFARYKNIHQPKGTNEVLKNLVKEIQSPVVSKPPAREPVFKPLKEKLGKSTTTLPLLPRITSIASEPTPMAAAAPTIEEPTVAPPVETISWDTLLAESDRQALKLTGSLLFAATRLREQALQETR